MFELFHNYSLALLILKINNSSIKKITRAALHQALLRLLWIVVRLLMFTYRYKFSETVEDHKKKIKSARIYAIWHEHILGFLSAHAWTEPYLTMASKSKDGDYAAYVCSRFGFTPVRGSSRKKNIEKGGKEAIEEYIQKLSQGISGGISVDGPKGPRHLCKLGIVKIAQLSGCPIIPGVSIISNYWEMNSWDKFKIPKPFSRITIKYGKPIWVDKNAGEEELKRICELVNAQLVALEAPVLSEAPLLKATA
jgi:lysophospholipid acyltransferase (LPLAT)-like uncharacterized protein